MEENNKDLNEDEKNKLLCQGCNSECCKYLSIEINTPEDEEDFEDIKWYAAHKNVSVYVDEDNEWHVEFKTSCDYLDKDGLCSIYNKRPNICREYSQDECPFHNEYNEKYTFKSIEDVESYIDNVFKQGKHELPEDDDDDEEDKDEESNEVESVDEEDKDEENA